MSRSWIKFAVIGLVIVVAASYLFLTGMKSSVMYYLTLEELLGGGKARVGDGVRLAGWVKEGSVTGSALDGGISFVMTDGDRDLTVSYRGQVPDTFQEGGEVIVEGIFRARPIFEAGTLLAKCPSKYEAAPPQANSPEVR